MDTKIKRKICILDTYLVIIAKFSLFNNRNEIVLYNKVINKRNKDF